MTIDTSADMGRTVPGVGTIVTVPIDAVSEHPENVHHGDIDSIRESYRAHGQYMALLVQSSTGYIAKGNHTHRALVAEGAATVDVVYRDMDDDTTRRIMLVDNRTGALGFDDPAALAAMLAGFGGDLSGTGYHVGDLDALLAGMDQQPPRPTFEPSTSTLAERFLIPPFSVFDARQGYWQDRKQRWLSIGLQHGAGRPEGLVYGPPEAGRGSDYGDPVTEQIADLNGGTSLFDPVLAEVLVTWFSRPGASILDPFAGGSARGVVAALLGRRYTGVDLSDRQVVANRVQAAVLCTGTALVGAPTPMPSWHTGDARSISPTWPHDGLHDMVLTCPPYFDLEVYGDDPRDLSRARSVEGFTDDLTACLTAAAGRLHTDRFVCIVMGEARDRAGNLDGLVPATVNAARRSGLTYYNEAILVTPVGTSQIRAARPFVASRKLTRGHQTVLVFVKGDARRAADWCGPVDTADLLAIINPPPP